VDDGCDGKQALGRLVDIHNQLNIDAVVGLPCSNGLSYLLTCQADQAVLTCALRHVVQSL